MRPDRIEAVLAFLNSKVDPVRKRKGWVVSTCPFAPWTHQGGSDRSPSFGVSMDTPGKRQVYTCFSCGEKGLLENLPFDVRHMQRTESKPVPDKYYYGKALQVLVADEDENLDMDLPEYDDPVDDPDEIIPWPEWHLDSFKSVFAFEDAVKYLATRQISDTVTQFLDLRFDSFQRRVCFPLRDWDGTLIGLHGRTIEDHPAKYFAYGYEGRRNPLPWLGEQWVDFDKPVVLCESVFDLASVLRYYKNSMCSLSVGMSEAKIKRIDQGVQFITFYDHGTGGDRARETLTKYLQTPHVHVTPATGDPGDMSKGVISDYLHHFLIN